MFKNYKKKNTMKKLLISLFLIMITVKSFSHEDWEGAIQYPSGILYVNYESTLSLGESTFWWSMCDCPASDLSYMSYQIYNEGYISDTQNVMHKELIYVTFQEPMGEGQSVVILGDNEWINDNDKSMENWVRNMSISASSKRGIHAKEHLKELMDKING